MKLNVLPDGEVGYATGIPMGDSSDGAKLMGVQQTIRDSYAEHEVRQCLAFAAVPSDYAGAVSLGIYAPPPEIGAEPLRRDRLKAFARKTANFVEALPGILLPLQTLDSLCLRLFGWICHKKEKPIASNSLLAMGL